MADSGQELTDYDNLLEKEPYLGGVLLVSLGSLAGIPPLAGFVAKLLVFVAAFQAGLYWMLGVALIGVVISIYYYFGWMRAAVMSSGEPETPVVTPPAPGARFAMGLLVAATLLLGFYQGFFVF